MAAGAPVVAAASGGLIEVIDGTGAGLLYPPGDTGALSGTLRRVLAQPDALADQQAMAFALLERRYTWDKVADATMPVYEAPPPAPRAEPTTGRAPSRAAAP
jgi:glycosyltransferase involved in cell wall biosynthesis